MKERDEWENELWSYIGGNDGIQCPLYRSCQLRRKGNLCISVDKELIERMRRFIDRDYLDSISLDSDFFKLPWPAPLERYQL
jgi:hypothetical protein